MTNTWSIQHIYIYVYRSLRQNKKARDYKRIDCFRQIRLTIFNGYTITSHSVRKFGRKIESIPVQLKSLLPCNIFGWLHSSRVFSCIFYVWW